MPSKCQFIPRSRTTLILYLGRQGMTLIQQRPLSTRCVSRHTIHLLSFMARRRQLRRATSPIIMIRMQTRLPCSPKKKSSRIESNSSTLRVKLSRKISEKLLISKLHSQTSLGSTMTKLFMVGQRSRARATLPARIGSAFTSQLRTKSCAISQIRK